MRCEAAITFRCQHVAVTFTFIVLHNTSKSKDTKNGKLTSLLWSTVLVFCWRQCFYTVCDVNTL